MRSNQIFIHSITITGEKIKKTVDKRLFFVISEHFMDLFARIISFEFTQSVFLYALAVFMNKRTGSCSGPTFFEL